MTLARNAFADRGKKAEDAVHKALAKWAEGYADREFNRLLDTRAAGRIVKSAAADFEIFAPGVHGLVEVKEVAHDYRLARDKLPQMARLRKREMAGGLCLVVVHHSTIKLWRIATAAQLAEGGDKGSWNLTDWPTYIDAGAALASIHEIFADLVKKEERVVYCHYCRKHKPSMGFKVLTDLTGKRRYRCPECHAVRTDPEALEAKRKKDLEIRRGEQATRALLAKGGRDQKRKSA